MHKKESDLFVSKVSSLLPVHSKKEREFLNGLKNAVKDYTDSNPNATSEEITDHFGEPRDIVQGYIDSMDIDLLIKKISTRRILLRFLIAILICAVIGLCVFVGFIYKSYLDYKNTLATEFVTVIEDE